MSPPQRRRSARLAVAVARAIDDDDGRSIDDPRRANAALEEEVRSPCEAARSPSLLERLHADANDVFTEHVLSRLDDGDLAVLATVNRKMRDVVFDSHVEYADGVKDVAAVRRELARVPNFVGSVGRLAWAKERGCPWEEETFNCIVRGGNVEVARWAKERGCPWGEDVHVHREGGNVEVAKWARNEVARRPGAWMFAPELREAAT